MIERQFINQKMKEFLIQNYLKEQLGRTGYSHTEIKRTPLGEKVVVYTTRPGLVVGKKGDNIKLLTMVLKKRFKLDNPQIEIAEVTNPDLDAFYVTDRIVSTLEKFGSKRFKSVGYKTLQNILNAGALGAEIKISGKLPSKRAKSWRFSAGYLKKSGDISENFVKKCIGAAKLKAGTIGVQVSIMTPDIVLPDRIYIKEPQQIKIEEIKVEEIKVETKPEEVTEVKEEKIEEVKTDVPEVKETESKIDIPKVTEESKEVKPKEKKTKEVKPKEKKTTRKTKDGDNKEE